MLDKINRIRFHNELPLAEFSESTSDDALRSLYYNSERPVSEHWRRIEAHFNDMLCHLVKFGKSLPQFEMLSGEQQHLLLSDTLLEVCSLFFFYFA